MKNFAVGQLAISIGTLPNGIHENFVGRIVSVEGEWVVLRAFDGEEVRALTSTLKQAVHYDVDQPSVIYVGESAHVAAIDHPELGEDIVCTSTVLRHNRFTRFFETRNTVYMANRIMSEFSPWLYK